MAFWLLLVAVLVVVVLVLTLAARQRLASEGHVYDAVGEVCSPDERAILETLEQVLDSRYRVFTKVCLAALIRPAPGMPPALQAATLRQLEGTILHFIICSADTTTLVGIVHCVPSSNDAESSSTVGKGVEQALAALNVPILFLSAYRNYPAEVVRQRLDECYAPLSMTVTSRDQGETLAQTAWFLTKEIESSATEDAGTPLCPRCSVPMVRRRAERGPHAGKSFWACAEYPRCRQLLQL